MITLVIQVHMLLCWVYRASFVVDEAFGIAGALILLVSIREALLATRGTNLCRALA